MIDPAYLADILERDLVKRRMRYPWNSTQSTLNELAI